MNFFSLTKPFSAHFSIISLLLILSACSTSPTNPDDIPPELLARSEKNSSFYLQKAQSEDDARWQFAALQALIKENKFVLADSVIEYLQTQPLNNREKSSLALLIADSFYMQKKSSETQIQLLTIDYLQLSEIGQIHYLQLNLELLEASSDHQEISDTLLLLIPLIKDPQILQQYHDQLLNELSLLPLELLNQYQPIIQDINIKQDEEEAEQTETTPLTEKQLSAEADPVKAGWYSLASLYQSYQLRPNQLLRSIKNWQENNPNHPALPLMPTQLTNLSQFSPYKPEKIAVLIPLSGRFEQQGKAIQYGLLDAFYQQQKNNRSITDETLKSVPAKIYFYDTQSQTMTEIVALLKKEQIDFVIGPLLKNNIKTFLPLVKNLPVLALNSFVQKMEATENELKDELKEELAEETNNKEVTDKIAWHYAFPLSPEEEVKQAAQLIFSDQHKKPLLLAPDSAYGKRLTAAFNTQWQDLTDGKGSENEIEAYYFKNKIELAGFIDKSLQTDKSKRRISQMQAIINKPLKTEVRSRRDTDAIYIISKRDELILLKPFIDVTISPFATKIPLYANSRSHYFDRTKRQNKELSKLTFSDSPFLLKQNETAFKEIQQAWPKQSFATLRLFALGFDSYQLIERLMQLQNSENYSYNGLAGQLSLDKTNTIAVKLSWAKYNNGALFEVIAPVAVK